MQVHLMFQVQSTLHHCIFKTPFQGSKAKTMYSNLLGYFHFAPDLLVLLQGVGGRDVSVKMLVFLVKAFSLKGKNCLQRTLSLPITADPLT